MRGNRDVSPFWQAGTSTQFLYLLQYFNKLIIVAETQANGIKVQQARSTGKQEEVEDQEKPRQGPDRNKAQDSLLLHLPTLSCEQGKVGG